MSLRTFTLALALLHGSVLASVASAQEVDASVEGEVASATDELQGRPNAANGAACGCSTVGARTEAPALAILGGVAMLGLVGWRARRV